MNLTTRIGKHDVAVRSANFPNLWHFKSGAHGRKEAGIFAFWTAVIKGRRGKGVIGRALVTLPPGDRFDRMRAAILRDPNKKARTAYRRIWNAVQKGKKIAYVRPSTATEVQRWADSHQKDFRHAKPIKVRR